MKHIKLDVSKMTPDEKITLGDKTGPACTANPKLPTCATKAAAVIASTHALRQAQAEVVTAESIWKQKIDARDILEGTWDKDSLALAAAVEGDALAGSEHDAALESSLFDLTSGVRPPPSPLDPVMGLNLTTNRFDAQVDAQWDRDLRAGGYEAQWTLTPLDEASWKNLPPTTRSKTTYTGLPSGQLVWIRVRGIGGSTGFSPWSDPASKRVP